MGKAETTSEAMEHIASVVDEVTSEILAETDKLLRTINSIQDKTNREIEKSDFRISEYQSEINALEIQIESYHNLEDEDHDYYSQIADCQQQINGLRIQLMKERNRNNELKQTLSQFRHQSAQTLKSLKQTNIATGNANTSGKQYIVKKVNIISSSYGKVIAGAATIGAGLGLFSHGENGESGITGENSSNQNGFVVKSFGNDKSVAQAWGRQAFQNWNRSLNIAERQAFIDYKKELYPHEASYYVNINNTLRGKDSFTDGNQMRYIRLHNALGRAEVPCDIIAYRGLSRDAYNSMLENSILAGGDGLRDNGFMSCSLACENLFNNTSDVILQLTIPEGTRGAYIGNVGNDFESECELLLDCGSSVFVTNTYEAPRSSITGYTGDTDIITIIEGVVEN